jgi:hypothetical protein
MEIWRARWFNGALTTSHSESSFEYLEPRIQQSPRSAVEWCNHARG